MAGYEADFFMNSAQAYAPMAGVRGPNMPFAFQGVPLIGDNPLLSMLLYSPMSNFMSASGMAPMGFHGQNIYDTMRSQMFWQQQMQFQAGAREMERENWMRTARGLAAATHTPFGSEQFAAAGALADVAAGASPYLAMFAPDLLDRMGGYTGSPTVMRQQIGMASRYRIDPVSGTLGGFLSQRPEQQNAYMQQIWDEFYGSGSGFTASRGVPAGELGQLYSQLQVRGMLPGFTGSADALRQFAAAGGGGGRISGAMTPDKVNSLLSDDGVATGLRAFDATRVSTKLKGYLDAVNAMRDIFGDMGKPNAPLPELLNALDMLTAGSLNKIEPGRLGQMVRTTQSLAQNAGLSMQQVAMLNQEAGIRVAGMGGDPIFGITAAQGGIAFGTAMRGMGIGATPMWGQKTVDQMTQLDMGLRAGATSSRSFYRASMASFLKDMYGGFAAGSDAANYMAALESAATTGVNTYTGADGKTHSLMLNQNEFLDMFNGAQLSRGGTLNFGVGDYNQLMRQTHMLGEYGNKFGYQDLVRRNQLALDVVPYGRNMVGAMLPSMLRGLKTGASDEQLRKAALAAGTDIINDLAGAAGTDAFGTDRAGVTGGILQNRLKAQGINISDTDAKALGGRLLGGLDEETLRSGRFGRGVGFIDMLVANNPAVTSMASSQFRTATVEGEIRTALAPLNRSDSLRRVMGYIQQMGDNGDKAGMAGVVATMLGGVDAKLVNDTILPKMTEINDKVRRLQQLDGEIANAPDATTRASKSKEREGLLTDINTLKNTVIGAFAPMQSASSVVSGNDVQGVMTALAAGSSLMGGIPDTAGLDPKSRASAFDSFWASDAGKQSGDASRSGYRRAEEIAGQIVSDRANLAQFGTKGVASAASVQAGTQKLRELASTYSRNKGDIGQLLVGDLDPTLDAATRERVVGEVKGVQGNIDKQMAAIKGYAEQGRSGWDLTEMQGAGFDKTSLLVEQKLNTSRDAQLDAYIRLQDRGKDLTDAERERMGKLETDLSAFGQTIGQDLTSMVNARREFSKNLTAYGDKVIGGFRIDPNTLANQLTKGFNTDLSGPMDPELARMLTGEQGHMLQGILAKQGKYAGMTRKAYGKQNLSDLDATRYMMDQYETAKRNGNVPQFFATMGMDKGQQQQFEEDMAFMQARGGAAGSLFSREIDASEIRAGNFSRVAAATAPPVNVNVSVANVKGTVEIKGLTEAVLELVNTDGESSAGVHHVPAAGAQKR